MPLHSNLVIGLKKVHVKQIIEQASTGRIEVHAKAKGRRICKHCGSRRVQSRGWRTRTLKHARQGRRLIEIHLKLRKFRCRACLRSGVEQVPHVLPRKRSTENFRQEVFELHQGGLTQSHLSKTHSISCSTVERWLWDFLGARLKELKDRSCPKILGIDEHFFTRKKGYATTLVDLGRKHKVFDVVLGRSEKSLEGYLRALKEKSRVQVVVMDLSASYRALIRRHFPNAMIVADRFHVVRLIQQQFQKLWGQLDPRARKNRGLLSLFRRHRGNMTSLQHERLEAYLRSVPGLQAIDQVQQRLLELVRLKGLHRNHARRLIPELLGIIEKLKQSGFELMQTLGNTLDEWLQEIGRMWRFRKTNSITEGFHNKMEMLSRRAFGFRNFQNYRIRVLALCGWDGLFTRIDL